jgi:hypothetical protein
MDEEEKKDQIEVLVSDGDHLLEGEWLPNTRITVAVGKNNNRVIRFEEDKDNEHVNGYYLRDDVNSPYASSPLMKGAPIQEALSEGMNRMMASAILNAEPPMAYDRYDTAMAAMGGPQISPGALNGLEDPESLRQVLQTDPQALMAVAQFLMKAYEDVTGVNDPRRGAETKSHTTAFAKDVEAARGQVRTDDYVSDRQEGLMTTILHKEYKIIKRVLQRPRPIFVNANGIKGWVNISAQDLPDLIGVTVHGALGPLAERENIEAKRNAFQLIIQMHGAAAQLQAAGVDMNLPSLDIEAMLKQVLQDAGENEAERFIRSPDRNAGQPQGGPGVPGAAGVVPGPGAENPALQAV